MAGKTIARVLLTIGFLAASVAYSSWTAERTIFDPSATRGATHTLLSTPTVRKTLAREIRTALAPALGGAAGSPKLTAAINQAVADPKFIGAFEDAIMSLNREILTGGDGRVTLDTHAVTTAIDTAVAHVDPKLAPKVRNVGTLSVPIGGSSVPHLGNAQQTVNRVGDLALALAIVLIAGALVLAPDRKMFRRTGRRVAFLALPPVLVFEVVPRLLGSSHNGALSVTAAILQTYGQRVMLSAAVLAVAGISTWLIAVALPARRREPAEPEAPATGRRARMPDTRLPSGEPTAPLPETLYL